MSIKALQEYTRIAKYANYLPELQRRETWKEQISRVFGMHRTKYDYALDSIEDELAWVQDLVTAKRVLGSQRALQFGGDPILKHNSRLFNCTVGYCDRPRFFQEAMYLLLCGCGVGFSVQHHHVAKLPKLFDRTDLMAAGPAPEPKVFVVPDTIEGWADAIGVLISAYMTGDVPFPEFQGRPHLLQFDFSQIRPEGAPLSSGQKAPGPDGLKRSLEKIRGVLEGALGRQLKPIEAYDIVMHAADAVISGGVRRSATIALFSPDDMEMAQAKTGNWIKENPQRGRSNNSALLIRDRTSFEDFKRLVGWTKEFGEPGFVWSDSTELLVNPCVEISMWPVSEQNGTLVSGWQFCNLCEINGRKCDTPESFFEACRAAAILGTLQAGYTSFPYLGQASEEITAREALLGVSITGMMDSPDVLFDPDTLQEGARIVKQTNAEIAAKIGINPAARTTCVKPAGTSSCILGTASGIHPHHARRYFRRVQANRQETPLQFYESRNPLAVQDSVWDPNGVTRLITFLCEVPKGARTKNQVDALTLLEHVKLVQQNWVVPGTNEDLCVQPWLRHNVSNTINVKEDEWDSVTEFIYQNREWYAGVSLLPNSGDKDYPQAPFCAVPYPREVLSEYGTAVLYAESLAGHAIDAFGDLWEACNVFLAGTDVSGDPAKENVTSMAREHADTWFDGDMRKLTYMLKDVYNILEWERISRAHQEVDWIEFIETDDSVNHAGESACAGGACELPDWLLEEMKKQS